MKTTGLFLKACVAAVMVMAFSPGYAQITVIKKNDALIKGLHAGKITGSIRYPKTIGVIGDFINTVKAKTVLNSYMLTNGQLTDKKTIAITSMSVMNVTRPDAPDYMYTYEINAVFPFNRPVDVMIDYGEYKFTLVLSLSKTDPNEYATMTDGDRNYSGFDFYGKSVLHPH